MSFYDEIFELTKTRAEQAKQRYEQELEEMSKDYLPRIQEFIKHAAEKGEFVTTVTFEKNDKIHDMIGVLMKYRNPLDGFRVRFLSADPCQIFISWCQ